MRRGAPRSTRSACSTRSASTRDARVVAVVHAETSTGVENDIAPLAALRDTDTLLLVDTVTSLGGIPVEIDEWGVDASYSGTQKCLGVPPGLSPVTFSPRAVERLQSRTSPVQSWYLDLSLIASYVVGRRHACTTTPRRSRWCSRCTPRSARCSTRGSRRRGRATGPSASGSSASCPELGFRLVVDDGHRLPELTTAWLPDGADDASLRKALLETYGIEVGGGLGEFAGKAWRIGLMGHTARERYVTTLLGALRELLA